MKTFYQLTLLGVLILAVLFAGCMPYMAKPNELTAPKPIYGNSGEYMCPYTQDNVLAEWTDKAISAKMGATIGKHAGAYAGEKIVENIPLIGGFLGSKAGEAAGRAIAIEMSGGWDVIKGTSDLSFNNMDDLAVYLYVKHSSNEHFQHALETTQEIYPDLKEGYYKAIIKASKHLK